MLHVSSTLVKPIYCDVCVSAAATSSHTLLTVTEICSNVSESPLSNNKTSLRSNPRRMTNSLMLFLNEEHFGAALFSVKIFFFFKQTQSVREPQGGRNTE